MGGVQAVIKKIDKDKSKLKSRAPFLAISKLLTEQQVAYSDYVQKSIHLSKKISRHLKTVTNKTRGQYVNSEIVDSAQHVSEQYVNFFIRLPADHIEFMKVRVHASDRELEVMVPFQELLPMNCHDEFVRLVNSHIQFAANNALFSFAESKIQNAADAAKKPVRIGIFGGEIIFSGTERCHISLIQYEAIGKTHLHDKTQVRFSFDINTLQATLVIPGQTSLTGKFSKDLDATLEYIKNL